MNGDRARTLVRELKLVPHPEGGFYREIYRSASQVQPADQRSRRDSLTTIYFLLSSGQHSRWHRVRSDEVWHFYEGDPLELFVAPPDLRGVQTVTLGPDERVHVVPAGCWQAARPTAAYCLAGCTVAPGFVFEDFAFLRDDASGAAALERTAPQLAALL